MKDKVGIKRDLLIDRKFPSPEQINQLKNFDQLKTNQALVQKLLMKKILTWSAVTGLTTIVIVGSIYLSKSKSETAEKKQEVAQVKKVSEPFVKAPLPGKEIQFSKYKVSATKPSVIKHCTGTVLTIPANAFVGKKGNAVQDSVEIRYREFHKPNEIFLSGIPMRYDSAGIEHNLESAGMIEIEAYCGDEELTLADQKQIDVNMVSNTDETRFNLYELDTVKRCWIYSGKDHVLKPSGSENKINGSKAAAAATNLTEEPVKPVMANAQKYRFNIEYEPQEFPELAAYKNVQFEVTDNSFKPAFYKINWDKISLDNSNTKGVFVIKLQRADTTIRVNAIPVFEKQDYEKAMSAFEANHKKYMEENSAKDGREEASLNEVNKNIAASSKNGTDLMSRINYNSRRSFSISRMGIHNIDLPLPLAIPVMAINAIKDKLNEAGVNSYSIIYMIERGKNTVFSFLRNEAVKFNPNADNLVWTVTDKNQFAFFSPSDYQKLESKGKKRIRPHIKDEDEALKEIREFSE